MIVLCGLSTTRAEQIGALPQESPLFIPQLLGAQYTGTDQHQFSLRERIVEAYYSFQVVPHVWLSPDM